MKMGGEMPVTPRGSDDCRDQKGVCHSIVFANSRVGMFSIPMGWQAATHYLASAEFCVHVDA